MLGRVVMNADVGSKKSTIQDALEAALSKKGGAAEKLMRAAMMTRSVAHGDLKGIIESLVDVRETKKEMKSREDADKEVIKRLEFLEESLNNQTKELNKKFDRVIDIFERKPQDIIRQAATGQRHFTDSRGRELAQNIVTGKFERRQGPNRGTDKQDGLDVLRGILDYQKKIHAQGERTHRHVEKGTGLTERAYNIYTRSRGRQGSPPGNAGPGFAQRAASAFFNRGKTAGGIPGAGGGGLIESLLGDTAKTALTAGGGGLIGSATTAAGFLAKRAIPFAARRLVPGAAMIGLAQAANSRNILKAPDTSNGYFDAFMQALDPRLAEVVRGTPAGAANRANSAGPNKNLFQNLPEMVNPRGGPSISAQVMSEKDDAQVKALEDMKRELKKKIEELKKGRPSRNFRDYRVDEAEKQISGIDNQISSIRSGGVAGGAGGRAGAGGSSGPYIPGVTPGAGQTESQAQADARQQVEQSKMPSYNPQFSPGTAAGAGGMTLPGASASPTGVTDLPLQLGASGGQFRPEYNLGAADMDPKVLSVIAGEARLKNSDGSWNQEGTDAVINNMLNRVGSKGWGPSDNLLSVATAPGQYAGSRPTSQSESEYIKSRITAIASGTVPDNTQGSNSYRAEGYYQGTKNNGPGYWAGSAEIGPNIGGNRFGKAAGVANGPYAQYADGPKNSTPAITASIPGLPGMSRASLGDIGPGVMGDPKNAQFATIDPSRIRAAPGETPEQLATRIQQMAPGMPSSECVALAKSAVGLDATPGANSVSDWRKGEGAQDGNLVRGAPVATFLDRAGNDSTRYDGGQGTGVSGNNTTHAAVFDSYATDKDGKRTGINVWEQYNGSGGAHMKTYNFGDQRGGTKAGENYYSINSASNNNSPLGGERNPMAALGVASATAGMPQAPGIPGAVGIPTAAGIPAAAGMPQAPAANDSLTRPFAGAGKSQFNFGGVAGRALGSNGYLGATGNINAIGAPAMGTAKTPAEMSTPSKTFERQPTPTAPVSAPAMANNAAAPPESKGGGGDDDKSEGAGDAAGGTKKMSEIEMQINDFGMKPLNSTDAA